MLQFFRKTAQSIASRYGYQIERKYDLERYRLNLLEILVHRVGAENSKFFFVQIGANDGDSYDPSPK
jgi:hypothetical protein